MSLRNKGYTILEIIVASAALALILLAIMPMITSNQQITKAQTIADETISYSKIFVKYLLDNDANVRKAVSVNNVTFIKWSDIKAGGYLPIGSINDKNSLGQTPCVAVMINPKTTQLIPFLFFVGGNNTANITNLDANNVMTLIGGMAGVYSNDYKDRDVQQYGEGVFGNKGRWYLPSSTQYLKQLKSGCGSELNSNSIAINMAMMAEYNGALIPDESIHRFRDPINPKLGDPNNTNTVQTDISLSSESSEQSNRLFFSGNDENSGVFLQSMPHDKTTVSLTNGNFSANTLQPTKSFKVFSSCKKDEIGKMAQQEDYIVVKSQLQCTFNPLQCQGKDPSGVQLNEYCYLPISEISITYHPNSDTFMCPQGYVDFTVPPIVTNSNPPPKFRGHKLICTNSIGDWCITWDTAWEYECAWQSPKNSFNKIGIKQWGRYSIATGISAITAWEADAHGWTCDYNSQRSVYPGIISAVTCTTTAPVIDYQ